MATYVVVTGQATRTEFDNATDALVFFGNNANARDLFSYSNDHNMASRWHGNEINGSIKRRIATGEITEHEENDGSYTYTRNR